MGVARTSSAKGSGAGSMHSHRREAREHVGKPGVRMRDTDRSVRTSKAEELIEVPGRIHSR